MKISRAALKSLVKECLVELLSDGLGVNLQEAVRSSRTVVSQPQTHQRVRATSQRSVPTAALQEAIRIESGGNRVLADILADTAVTTLPAQMSNSRPDGSSVLPLAGPVEELVARATPEQLFGEEAVGGRWADLAFAAPSPRKASA